MKKFLVLMVFLLMPVLVFGLNASISPTQIKKNAKGVFAIDIVATENIVAQEIAISIPDGFSPPDPLSNKAGWFSISGAKIKGYSIINQTITINGITLKSGETMTVLYGSKIKKGKGALSPNVNKIVNFIILYHGDTLNLPVVVGGGN